MPVGSTYVYIDNSDTKIYKKTSTTPTTVKTLANNDVMQIQSVVDSITQIGIMQMFIIQITQLH